MTSASPIPASDQSRNPPIGDPIVLVIDDEPMILRTISRALQRRGFRVLMAATGTEGLQILGREGVDVALVDIGLPDMSGLEVIRAAQESGFLVECVAFTGQADVQVAFDSLEAGASDYFEKPIQDWTRFDQVLRRAAEVSRLKQERDVLRSRSATEASDLIGNSATMEDVRRLVAVVARSEAATLITGESGTGKELVAEAIHEQSGRPGPLVRVNCAAVPRDLIEGELFGWEKGAHSMATQSKQGLFEVAAGGTILLDEIGAMPIELQPKLLRVLEGGTFRPIGATGERPMTARVLGSTNTDLDKAMRTGEFRQDLYYRLAVLVVTVPPLRERRDDLGILCYYFINRFNETEKRDVRRVDPVVLRIFEAYDWPGNVRELRNVVHRAVLLTSGEVLGPESLPAWIRQREAPAATLHDVGSGPVLVSADDLDLRFTEAKNLFIERFTRAYLRRRLERSEGNITRAAEAAGMKRPNFHRLLRNLGVDVETLLSGEAES